VTNPAEEAFREQDAEFTAWWDGLPKGMRAKVRKDACAVAFLAGYARGEIVLCRKMKEAGYEQPK